MAQKKSRGVTLVELIVSVALLAVVMAAAGSAVYSASQSFAITRKMQEDEYNARLALLSITREVHRGVTAAEPGANQLRLVAHDRTTEIIYRFDATDKMLYREGDVDDTPVPFAATELESFSASSDGRLLTLEVECRYGLKLKTTVAVLRVPPPAGT